MAGHVSPTGLRSQSANTCSSRFDLALGLLQMVHERLPQFGRVGLLGHLRQGLQNLLFGIVDVLEQMDEKVLQRLHFGHEDQSPLGLMRRGAVVAALRLTRLCDCNRELTSAPPQVPCLWKTDSVFRICAIVAAYRP